MSGEPSEDGVETIIITRPEIKNVIASFEALLQDAKDGNIKGFVCIAGMADGHVRTTGFCSFEQAQAMIAIVAREILPIDASDAPNTHLQ